MKAILMNNNDNVATMLADAEAGDSVAIMLTSGRTKSEVNAKQKIPFGHKISMASVEIGQKILKYGEVIGEATLPISVGDHVHIHNVRSMTWGKFG